MKPWRIWLPLRSSKSVPSRAQRLHDLILPFNWNLHLGQQMASHRSRSRSRLFQQVQSIPPVSLQPQKHLLAELVQLTRGRLASRSQLRRAASEVRLSHHDSPMPPVVRCEVGSARGRSTSAVTRMRCQTTLLQSQIHPWPTSPPDRPRILRFSRRRRWMNVNVLRRYEARTGLALM